MHEILLKAAEKGMIRAEQVEPLTAFLETHPAEQASAIPAARFEDDEKIQFIGGFNDIFVAIGVLLLVSSSLIFGISFYLYNSGTVKPSLAVFFLLGNIMTFCFLNELFARQKLLPLASSCLSVCFAIFTLLFLIALFGYNLAPLLLFGFILESQNIFGLALASSLAAGLVYLHFTRYHTAINPALMVCCFIIPFTLMTSLGGLLSNLLGNFFIPIRNAILYMYTQSDVYVPLISDQHISAFTGVAGILTLFIALYFDGKDPLRKTKNTDIAFWLHLLAAPLIVHSFFVSFGFFETFSILHQPEVVQTSGATISAILAMFVLFGTVAIIIDRRAMLVSGLSYCGYAIYATVEPVAAGGRMGATGATLLFLGLGVVLLGFGWRPIRKLLIIPVPAKIRAVLPPAASS